MGAETATETTTVSTTTLLEPNDNDVLSGRGGLTNHHPGNKKYRKWVEDHKEKYRQGTMNQKTTIAKQIIHMVKNQDPPGRFLKRDNRNNPWFELDDEKAEKKTKQALRENKDTPETAASPAVDPTAPKLIYGDALMMAPPKLVTAEVRQNSFHMVEAYVNCDHLATAASVREHSLGAEELLVGDKLEVARDFSWGSSNPNGNGSSSSDLINPIPYKPAMSRAQQFQMMELRKLREQYANDDSDQDLKTAFRPQQQQQHGNTAMHGVNPSIAIQWASRGTQLDASNPHMYMPTATATMHTASSSSLLPEDMAMLQYDDEDVYDPAELMAAPIDSPFPSANGGTPNRKSFVPDVGGGSLLHRPDVAKRATSNQCETEETRSSYHHHQDGVGGSVKRVALNRDNSSTANRLKAMYLPGTVSIDSQMQSLNVSMQQSTLRTNAAIDVDAKSIDNNSSMEFDPIPLDNNSVMDSSNGSDFLTESAALALLQASHSPGAKSTQASLESVDEEEAPEQVQPAREESMSLETMIPLADPATKPSSLGRTDRMSTDQYVKAIEGSLGSVGSDSLGKFVDQVLANPDRVLMRGMPPSFGSWRESIPDDDDDHDDDDFADDEASARGQQEQ